MSIAEMPAIGKGPSASEWDKVAKPKSPSTLMIWDNSVLTMRAKGESLSFFARTVVTLS